MSYADKQKYYDQRYETRMIVTNAHVKVYKQAINVLFYLCEMMQLWTRKYFNDLIIIIFYSQKTKRGYFSNNMTYGVNMFSCVPTYICLRREKSQTTEKTLDKTNLPIVLFLSSTIQQKCYRGINCRQT